MLGAEAEERAIATQAGAEMALGPQRELDLEASQKMLEKRMKDAATQTAAIQTGISIGLNVLIPVGPVIAAVYGLVTLITGRQQKRQIKAIIDGAVDDIRRYKEASNARVMRWVDVAVSTELPVVRARLAAGVVDDEGYSSIDGLGSAWTDLRSKAGKVARKTVVRYYTAAPRAAVRGGLWAGSKAASAAGDKTSAKKMERWGDTFRRSSGRFEQASADALKSPKAFGKAVEKVGRIVSGYEQVTQVRQRAAELVADAKRQIDAEERKSIEATLTPEFRENLRRSLSKALRSDPQLLAEAQEAASIAATENADVAKANADAVAYVEDPASDGEPAPSVDGLSFWPTPLSYAHPGGPMSLSEVEFTMDADELAGPPAKGVRRAGRKSMVGPKTRSAVLPRTRPLGFRNAGGGFMPGLGDLGAMDRKLRRLKARDIATRKARFATSMPADRALPFMGVRQVSRPSPRKVMAVNAGGMFMPGLSDDMTVSAESAQELLNADELGGLKEAWALRNNPDARLLGIVGVIAGLSLGFMVGKTLFR